MSPDLIDVLELIPHRPPMVMIDRLVRCDAASAEATKTFREGEYGVGGGRVEDSLLVECVAQTVAAMQGYAHKQQGGRPSQGMLVGIDDFSVHAAASAGVPLTIEVSITHTVGQFRIVSGSVTQQGKLVAQGQVKVFLQEEP